MAEQPPPLRVVTTACLMNQTKEGGGKRGTDVPAPPTVPLSFFLFVVQIDHNIGPTQTRFAAVVVLGTRPFSHPASPAVTRVSTGASRPWER